MYGLVLFNYPEKHDRLSSFQHSVARQRALQGAVDRAYDTEAIQLLRINIDDDPISQKKVATISTPTSAGNHHTSNNLNESEGKQADNSTDRTSSTMSELSDWKLASTSGEMPLDSSDVEAKMRAEAEEHAHSVHLLPSGDTRKRSLKCIGWRNTGDCSPDGPREPHKDLSCYDFVPNNASGYCEVEDTKSGERFRVMRHPCNVLRTRVPFRCINAPAFARFRVQAHTALEKSSAHDFKLPNVAASAQYPRDGIVMVVYPKLVPSAFATIRALRDILHCSLPIEIWFRPDEMELAPEALEPLEHLAKNTTIGKISFHPITDPTAKRFVAKIYAIYHSVFDRVLFLDADNVPVRDPSFLFDSPEFVQNGAVFWPDFWHPTSTMFGLHSKSLLWELLDMPFVDMFEQESGQLVVDRRRHAAPLELVMFYATHNPNFLVHYRLAWGDKDLFRLAWLKLNATFHMIETPPAMAGVVTNSSAFCGMTMVQHDVQGEVLFLHRNKHKLTGTKTADISDDDEAESDHEVDSSSIEFDHVVQDLEVDAYPDPAIWRHMMSFDRNSSRDDYVVQAFTTSLDFTNKQKCFGRRSLSKSPQFRVRAFADFTFDGLETELRHFAKEAAEKLR
ncbi:hypothetical protein PF005_g9923 [Phytophthora fragariae]|nr:hypothetical protein PF011_g8800 [Phytophthora fragariae]KAE9214173.1 hypothetical protein PF005_g9923 [Phytophthora fragariae]KAE9272984.1 hypothetical protein PF001_g27708 [Phytophthora fragariae]